MQLTKCENGHIYNAEKFRSCPHCSKLNLAGQDPSDTFGRNQADIETALAELAATSEVGSIINKRVVGMLVVVEGDMIGSGFLLKEGSNSIGRSSNMDVPLTKEPTVSRKVHAAIDFEDGSFILNCMDEEKQVFLNEQLIDGTKKLKDKDIIRLGDCCLTFIEAGSIWK